MNKEGPKLLDPKVKSFILELINPGWQGRLIKLIKASEIYTQTQYSFGEPFVNILLLVTPEFFKTVINEKDTLAEWLAGHYKTVTGQNVTGYAVLPNLEKYQATTTKLLATVSPWDQINEEQNQLIFQLNTANHKRDYQNIGNTARQLVLLLADTVFNPNTHKAPAGVLLDRQRYKNRLHTYIKSELSGSKNSEILSYTEALIETVEKGIDFMNALTHEEEASEFFAESCVVSTLSLVRIITLIHQHKFK